MENLINQKNPTFSFSRIRQKEDFPNAKILIKKSEFLVENGHFPARNSSKLFYFIFEKI
jgi:hypothetical protein